MNSSHKKSNNYNNNIYNFTNLESNNSTNSRQNLGNIIRFSNINFQKIYSKNYTKKSIISDISNSKQIINNYSHQNDNNNDNKNIIIDNKNLQKQIDIINNNQLESKFSKNENVLSDNKNRILKSRNVKIKCFICERYFNENKMFYPKCLVHSLCKKCLKNYYEDIFENNIFLLKCPDTNCNKEIDLNILKSIISNVHYEVFMNNQNLQKINNNIKKNFNNGKEIILKDTKITFNSKISYENMKLYTQKNVLDINSNEKIYMYKKNKDIFCYNCLQPTLFTKINGHFIKCLNCHYKICRYCFKEFDDFHMDIMTENHCKIYNRKDEYYSDNGSILCNFWIQLFFVFAIYYLMFAGIYFIISRFIESHIKFNNNILLKCCFSLFIFLISFTILLIICPFLIIIHPFFPAFLSSTDY